MSHNCHDTPCANIHSHVHTYLGSTYIHAYRYIRTYTYRSTKLSRVPAASLVPSGANLSTLIPSLLCCQRLNSGNSTYQHGEKSRSQRRATCVRNSYLRPSRHHRRRGCVLTLRTWKRRQNLRCWPSTCLRQDGGLVVAHGDLLTTKCMDKVSASTHR